LNAWKHIKTDEIDEMSVFKLVHIFYVLKSPYEQIKFFDNILRNKLKYYTSDEYIPLFKFLTEIGYKNEKTLELLKQLDSAGSNNYEKIDILNKNKLL
jgi:hypothetical protein